MPFAASYSRATNISDAIRSVTEEIRAALGKAEPDFSFLFVSHDHAEGLASLPHASAKQRGPKC